MYWSARWRWACRGHHELVLENLALRQQLHALRRAGTRPQLRRCDRLFWIVLAQTWRTFLTNHVVSMVSIDFFTVATLTGRVLFVFVVLMHHRRRIVHVNVTEHPTAVWTAQQLIDAFRTTLRHDGR